MQAVLGKWVVASVFAATVTVVPPSMASAQESEIRAVVETWPALLDGGDVDDLMNLFTDDLVFMHPRFPGIVSRDSVRVFVEQVFRQQYAARSSIRIEDLQVSGDWAHVVARFETSWTPRSGGNPFPETARYLWVLRHDATGAWRVRAFVFYPVS